MLYDKRWEKTEIKADPFSLDSLIVWLEKQPSSQIYCYFSNGECLLSQYFTHAGFENVCMFTHGFWHGPDKIPGHVGMDEAIAMGRLTGIPRDFDHIAGWGKPTFGAALQRARKIAQSSSIGKTENVR